MNEIVKQELMNKIALTLALFLMASGLAGAQTLISEQSIVKFSIKNLKVRTVEGTFTGMAGEIRFVEDDPANAAFLVSVDAASVNTENKRRDDHLRSEDFFDVEKYPAIRFESDTIQKTTEGFTTRGRLSLHGVTREVEIPFTFDDNQFKGHLEINRLDYKVGEGTGTFTAGEIASLEILVVVE